MLCPGAESVQVIYEHTAHLQAIYYTHPSHSLSLALPIHNSCFSSSTKLLIPNVFEHPSDINEHILTMFPWGHYHHLQRTCLWLYNLWQIWEGDQEIWSASAPCSNHSALPLLPFMSRTSVCWLRTTKQISHGNKLLQSQQTWAGFEPACYRCKRLMYSLLLVPWARCCPGEWLVTPQKDEVTHHKDELEVPAVSRSRYYWLPWIIWVQRRIHMVRMCVCVCVFAFFFFFFLPKETLEINLKDMNLV